MSIAIMLTFVYKEKIHFQMKRALITGITGQDGAYLAKFLLALLHF